MPKQSRLTINSLFVQLSLTKLHCPTPINSISSFPSPPSRNNYNASLRLHAPYDLKTEPKLSVTATWHPFMRVPSCHRSFMRRCSCAGTVQVLCQSRLGSRGVSSTRWHRLTCMVAPTNGIICESSDVEAGSIITANFAQKNSSFVAPAAIATAEVL